MLTCWDEGPANVTVSWRVEERGAVAVGGRSRQLAEGNTLHLQRLRYEDSGRYSCSVGGRPLRSLRLLVEEPPETPHVSCYRRSHDKDVLCEWPQRVKPSPGTRATLWVKRRFSAENATEQRCRYFSKARKFVCRVKVPPGADDTKPLVVSTCVSNAAGGSAGEDRIITLSSVLKPDPPLNVTVEALEKAPQRLRVNWSYPSSWDPRFYWLRFQVRYRPEPAQTFTEVDQVMTTWLDIRDAWRGTRHVVQVRAQEEFGHGTWSEWSREAVGTPWTDPRDLTSEMGPFSSQFPMEDGTSWVTLPPELFRDAADGAGGAVVEASARSTASPYPFLVAGGSLLLGIALFVGIVVRYRRTWQTGGQRSAKPEGEGQHVLVPLSPPSPPLSDTPLLSSPAPPAPGGLHVTNLDYFFSGQ
ncbi:PREDICTED: interleukin-6 receptor subunit alpha [Calidris pugnax]|uniref:interleukin-6 receptor subunit alpha n=1 Tax=Calidris pugnax TaxID=198806 RepID=UPI00071D2847|nr:PREDICTED: interleukin-6 receptor subunit alpha [Calidris pugnax]